METYKCYRWKINQTNMETLDTGNDIIIRPNDHTYHSYFKIILNIKCIYRLMATIGLLGIRDTKYLQAIAR